MAQVPSRHIRQVLRSAPCGVATSDLAGIQRADESATVSWPDFTESKYRESRQHDGATAQLGFWIYDYLVPVHPLQAALDPDFAGVEVQILPFQSEGFFGAQSEAYAADQPCLELMPVETLQQLAYLADIQNLRFITARFRWRDPAGHVRIQ